uniref:thiamine phosphate synthase n=1 Tax=Allorhizocola rhizosphaerae TaxID=1872709 RepID=UPI0013C2D378
MDLSLIVVTDRHLARRPLLDVVAAALEGGARTFLLREKDLPSSQRHELADAMRTLGADVIVAGTDPLGGNAIHLAAADPFPAPMAAPLASGRPLERSGPGASGGPLRRSAPIGSGWRPSPGGPLGLSGRTEIGRSCHAVDEVVALEWETYCTLSPIFATASKPGYGPALGTAAIERALVSRPRKAASRARGTATLAGGSAAGEVAGTLAGGSAAGEVA